MRPGAGNGPSASPGNMMRELSEAQQRGLRELSIERNKNDRSSDNDDDDDDKSSKSDESNNNSSNGNGPDDDRDCDSPSPPWKGCCNFCGNEFCSPTKLADHIKSQCKEAAIAMKQEKKDSSPVVS